MCSQATKNWARRHIRDPYVQKAQQQNCLSRAFFKLEAIDKKYQLIKKHRRIADIGCAPGGWCQYLLKATGGQATVVGCDLLPIDLSGVIFVQGDFTDAENQQQILSHAGGLFDVIVSDMAPNISGIADVDQQRMHHLLESLVDFVQQALAPGGAVVCKFFAGGAHQAGYQLLKTLFTQVDIFKPDSSRKASREGYYVCRGYSRPS